MSDDPETTTHGDDREPEVTDDGRAGPDRRRPDGDPPIRSAGAGPTPASDHLETTTNRDDRGPEVTDDGRAGPDRRRPDGDPPIRSAGAGPTPASDTTPSAGAGWQVRQLIDAGRRDRNHRTGRRGQLLRGPQAGPGDRASRARLSCRSGPVTGSARWTSSSAPPGGGPPWRPACATRHSPIRRRR